MKMEKTIRPFEIFSIIAAILTACFVLNEYWENKSKEEINRTLQYSHVYREAALLQHRVSLHMTVEELKLDQKGRRRSYRNFSDKLIATLNDGSEWVSYEVILEFFDSLHDCVVSDLCQLSAAKNIFSDEACYLSTILFSPITSRIANGEKRHAEGLLFFARHGKTPSTKFCSMFSDLNN